MEPLTVIKVGGKIVEETESLNDLLCKFSTIQGAKALVHGGGRSATRFATQLGIESKMVEGRRITDQAMLQVVTMVYGGLVNKNIVAGLQAKGINALGLTGADLAIIKSDKRPVKEIDYGFVGDVKQVNDEMLANLIQLNITPVMAPLSYSKQHGLLNTNAKQPRHSQNITTPHLYIASKKREFYSMKPTIIASYQPSHPPYSNNIKTRELSKAA